jgi:hypothetical protein
LSARVERVVAQLPSEGLAESCAALLRTGLPGARVSLCRLGGVHTVTIVQEVAEEDAPFTEAQEQERAEALRLLYGRAPARLAS